MKNDSESEECEHKLAISSLPMRRQLRVMQFPSSCCSLLQHSACARPSYITDVAGRVPVLAVRSSQQVLAVIMVQGMLFW